MPSGKLSFQVPEDSGAPVEIEHLHCDFIGEVARVASSPFLIPDLALGDEIVPTLDTNGTVVSWKLLKAGAASTIWLMNTNDLDLSELLADLQELGCSHEGLPALRLISIAVALAAPAESVDSLLSRYEDYELPRAFPCWRHSDA